MIQWGLTDTPSGGQLNTVYFSPAFRSGCTPIISYASYWKESTSLGYSSIFNYSNTGFQYDSNRGSSNKVPIAWIAFGLY